MICSGLNIGAGGRAAEGRALMPLDKRAKWHRRRSDRIRQQVDSGSKDFVTRRDLCVDQTVD